MISDAIEEFNVPLPYQKITRDEMLQDFQNLTNLDCTTLIKTGNFFTRYDYVKKPITNTYIDLCNIGNKSSNYFHQEQRFKCDSINSPSPYRTWTTEKFRLTLLNALWTMKVEKVNMDILRMLIAMRKYIASQFRPSAAKAIYQYFNAEHVLDFSMGWGDRLAAFLATENTKRYLGLDPNKILFENYSKQFQSYKVNKFIIFDDVPAENYQAWGVCENRFDMVFTSPPYFNIERYTQEENQSWKRYKKVDKWLDGFLFPVLSKSYTALKSGGHMVINISDVYSLHQINKICDPMNEYLEGLGMQYIDCWGLRLQKRPNSKSDKVGIFCEPIWIWKKG